jgi:hypothetical protein
MKARNILYQALGKVIDLINVVEETNSKYTVSPKYKNANDNYENYLYWTESGYKEMRKSLVGKSVEEISSAQKRCITQSDYAKRYLEALVQTPGQPRRG